MKNAVKGQQVIEVESIEVKGEEVVQPKRKQAISKSYTVKAFTENSKRLIKLGYVSKENAGKLLEIAKEAVDRYVEETFK